MLSPACAGRAQSAHRKTSSGVGGGQRLVLTTQSYSSTHFDELVTNPAIKLAEVEAYLATLEGNQRFRGRYWMAATSGTTGRPGIEH